MQTSDRDALASLPSPDELRQALSRRVREADVLRRLLRVSEYATTELQEPDPDIVANELRQLERPESEAAPC